MTEIQNTSENIFDVLAQKKFQQDQNYSKELSILEDQLDDDYCAEDIENNESCQGFAQSLLPPDKKKHGWRTLFEIKYQDVGQRSRRSLASSTYNEAWAGVGVYRDLTNEEPKDLKTAQDLEAEITKISHYLADYYEPDLPTSSIRTALIIEQMRQASDDHQMAQKLTALTSNLNSTEYLHLVTAVIGSIEYNHERAAFLDEQSDATRGKVTPQMMMSGSKFGVCGDIHAMAAKMAEQRGWEAFTVGYSLAGMQHVVTALMDPRDKDKLMIVNYGNYEEHDLTDGRAVTPTPTNEGWEEIGSQFRVFKNDRTGDNTGKMDQIATVPTALGTFMNDLFKKDYQASKAMVSNQNYSSKKATFEHTAQKVKEKKEGQKVLDRSIGEGIIVYEGETENAKIYGIGVSFDVYKQIYRYNKKTKKCEPKKNKYFSTNFAGNFVDLKQAQFDQTFYAYLNMKYGQIIKLYESEFFQFRGVIGLELEGFVATYEKGFLTGDGNLTSLLGVMADYEKKGTKIHSALTLENNIGLKDQNLMTDFSALPKNLQMGFNAIKLKTDVSQKVSPKTTLTGGLEMTGSKVGSQVILTTGVIHKNTSLNVSYQGGMKAIPIGNHLKEVNLLRNMNNADGLRIGVTQNFSNRKGTFSGSLSGYGGMSTSTPSPQYFGGAGVKINLQNNRKKKRAP